MEHKNEGNKHFKAGKYEDAIISFTKAIEVDPDNAIFYSNRSSAYLKIMN